MKMSYFKAVGGGANHSTQQAEAGRLLGVGGQFRITVSSKAA